MAALEYLHTRQPPVIFRDLKPSTIMRETAGTLKLIDFGIARRLDTKRTEQTVYTMIGTPGCCPPEQYQGLADPRSDVYSLGATLHHLISGRDSRRHQPFTFPPLSTLVPAIDPAVDAAITRAVSLQAGDRFASVAAFRAALTAPQTTRVAAPAGSLTRLLRRSRSSLSPHGGRATTQRSVERFVTPNPAHTSRCSRGATPSAW
jgi:eukaryotic-like serine/threonine-protein kinase